MNTERRTRVGVMYSRGPGELGCYNASMFQPCAMQAAGHVLALVKTAHRLRSKGAVGSAAAR